MSAPLRVGSVCSGYGGLDVAVARVFGGRVAWVADPDPGAAAVLAAQFPGVPNLGDIRSVDWADVEPVDVVCGGYPCQPFSDAGSRRGTADERHIWPWIAGALRVLRPQFGVFENVSGHLRRGFDRVLADLAGLGFDAEWDVTAASDVGAAHRRKRLFVLATAADAPHLGHQRDRDARHRWTGPAHSSLPTADAGCAGLALGPLEPDRHERPPAERGGGQPAAHTDGGRRRPHLADLPTREPDPGRRAVADAHSHGREEQQRSESGLGAWGDADGRGPQCWGRFAPAIARWEAVTGRRAPWATDHRGRLNPHMVEWMMGLPSGWVTDVPGLTRTQQLRLLGNGVVPQQAETALHGLATRHLAAGEAAA
ncbi:DNA cytosine methyltransferase [Streptomyces profundus]|nr:DNA cytosine methyltransferase [Streptomyces sp. MA3_2.13]